jgi:hypothetical protein
MNNVVFWDVTPRGSCNKGSFGGKHSFHHQGEKNHMLMIMEQLVE